MEIFLLRQESSESKSFVLSILDNDKFKHIKIEHIEDSFFKIPNRIIFHGIESIIEKFKLKKFAIGFYPPKHALKFGITNIIHRLVQNDYLNMLAQILIHPRCPSLDSKNTTGLFYFFSKVQKNLIIIFVLLRKNCFTRVLF